MRSVWPDAKEGKSPNIREAAEDAGKVDERGDFALAGGEAVVEVGVDGDGVNEDGESVQEVGVRRREEEGKRRRAAYSASPQPKITPAMFSFFSKETPRRQNPTTTVKKGKWGGQ